MVPHTAIGEIIWITLLPLNIRIMLSAVAVIYQSAPMQLVQKEYACGGMIRN